MFEVEEWPYSKEWADPGTGLNLRTQKIQWEPSLLVQDCRIWVAQEDGATDLQVQDPDSKIKTQKKAADIAQW